MLILVLYINNCQLHKKILFNMVEKFALDSELSSNFKKKKTIENKKTIVTGGIFSKKSNWIKNNIPAYSFKKDKNTFILATQDGRFIKMVLAHKKNNKWEEKINSAKYYTEKLVDLKKTNPAVIRYIYSKGIPAYKNGKNFYKLKKINTEQRQTEESKMENINLSEIVLESNHKSLRDVNDSIDTHDRLLEFINNSSNKYEKQIYIFKITSIISIILLVLAICIYLFDFRYLTIANYKMKKTMENAKFTLRKTLNNLNSKSRKNLI